MRDDYYLDLAAAYVRGALPDAPPGLGAEALIGLGRARGLDLHTFKRSRIMPRVRAALSAVKALAPSDLLDIGSGRGAFLWPFVDEVPWLPVTGVDVDPGKADLIGAVSAGGIAALSSQRADAASLPFADGAFDAVTILEVLEHLKDPEAAAREAVRAARRAVVATVPSRPDDNPGHLRLYTPASLGALFFRAGAGRVKVEEVAGSFLCIARP